MGSHGKPIFFFWGGGGNAWIILGMIMIYGKIIIPYENVEENAKSRENLK